MLINLKHPKSVAGCKKRPRGPRVWEPTPSNECRRFALKPQTRSLHHKHIKIIRRRSSR